uniref:PHD-type domain-containing protein n=1 Tax=Helobdella robusta TaxID=6412 RepID=T1EGP7_HELRO
MNIPKSSSDLILADEYVMQALGIYEVLRRFSRQLRLSHFRFEDLCSALTCSYNSPLIVEIHVCLMKCLLKADDNSNMMFGPQDTKDSVNIFLMSLDHLTWYEIVSAYLNSGYKDEFENVCNVICKKSFYTSITISERLSILQCLTDLFLRTNAARLEIIREGMFQHEDQCRSCHKLGDLICCELCPSVYHLECVGLTEVPEGDWICSLCTQSHVKGVSDCLGDMEVEGMLSRHEPLGYDRHLRRYWFLSRRIFVESEDGNAVHYYSTPQQFEELYLSLDADHYENDLVAVLYELKDEIKRQMDLTIELTKQFQNSKKSTFDILYGWLNEKEKYENARKKVKLCNGDDNRESSALVKSEKFYSQTPGEFIVFTLTGHEGTFLKYENVYSTNACALNRQQHFEEKEKKRHLSYKFNIPMHGDFRWGGSSFGSLASIISTYKTTLLLLESHIPTCLLHPRWQTFRPEWLNLVATASTSSQLAHILAVLQVSIKPVLFNHMWHEMLGHTSLKRISTTEFEENKKKE